MAAKLNASRANGDKKRVESLGQKELAGSRTLSLALALRRLLHGCLDEPAAAFPYGRGRQRAAQPQVLFGNSNGIPGETLAAFD